MASRRMFSKTIIDSDEFLEMPVSARLLYYDLGMRADDDGFVNPKRIMRIIGAADDDLKVLLAKKYVLNFENKVLVIRDWKVNNFIRPDRYTPTIYQEYLKRLQIIETKQYQLNSGIPPVIPLGDPELGKVRLGKVRLGNGSAGKSPQPLKKPKTDDNEPMDLQAFMVYCEKSPQKHIQVIGAYAELKKPKFATYGQWQSFIKRNLRPARLLSPYTEEQLGEAMLKIQKRQDKSNGGYITEWTLETLTKFLDH